MGKRGRKQKKEVFIADSNSAPIPDKSPRITDEQFCFPENQDKDAELPSAAGVTSGKITSYFPRSPESRGRQEDLSSKPRGTAPRQSLVQGALKEDTEIVAKVLLPPLGILTPDTTPTKDPAQPHNRPASPPHDPSRQEAPPAQASPVEDSRPNAEDSRPNAAQRLEYGASSEGGEEKVGAKTSRGSGRQVDTKKADGKQSKRSKARARKSRQAKSQVQSPSTTLKDYFPVRRSERKCKSAVEAEETKMLHEAVLSCKEEGVEVQNILGKGRGVVATRAFSKGDFVVEYHGDHVDIKTAKHREQEYAANPEIGCYMYYYQFKNKSYCVDATQESKRIGRLLNHSKTGNCMTKLISIRGKPYLILVAATSISEGEELDYDYGDRNKDSIQSHPWLAL